MPLQPNCLYGQIAKLFWSQNGRVFAFVTVSGSEEVGGGGGDGGGLRHDHDCETERGPGEFPKFDHVSMWVAQLH